MDGPGNYPPFREDYPPPMDYNRGPPPPGGPGMYPPPGPGGYAPHPRSPLLGEPDFRGRHRSDSRGGDPGYDGGRHYGGGGHWGNRSRSRSPPGGRFHRGGGGGGGGFRGGPPPGPAYGGDWQQGLEDHGANGANNGRVERKAVQSIEPMDSYKVFMMRQDENSTPETYQQRYEEYKKKYTQRLMRAFFDDHKREEWLQERYSPAIRFRLDQQKRSKKVAEAKLFVERIASGTAKINLDEEHDLTGKDYDNDLEDSKRILYVRRIPCACPVATLSEAIKKAGGNFQHIYLSDPVKKSAFDFDRSAYIIYETPEAAAEALPKIHNTFVQDADLFPPFRLQVSQHRSRAPLKTPSYLSVPERISADYNQALKLTVLLDNALYTKASDLASLGIEALLEKDEVASAYSTEKQKLDVVVAYLRRVHHYIYYAGVQCIDMGDIMHAHPALFCRPPPTSKDLEEEQARKESVGTQEESSESKTIGGWAASLDEKVQAYIEELSPEKIAEKLEKEKALVEEIETREESSLESTYSNYAEKAGDDGKHRCRLCTKLFKALDFVKKHIRNKHPELAVDKIAEVGESYMWEQYREDANRPLPPIETTNTLTNPVLGGRGNNGSPFQGRGQGRGPYGGGPPGGNRGYYRDGPGYRGGGGYGPPRDSRARRGSFGDRGRSPPRRAPEGDLPVDPRQVTKSYQDLDNLQDTKVELSFDALDSLPPPKKKSKV
ncbi:hypothetical protein Poli38472_013795 [Pythium oligandrum]|uniref:C2H2-type domain-containing protein n=1 Tax=Pythium oligandrum TaxID=41045 RepID=A0A8K1FDM8_PYTOL|nr:hypothetical protein Poli38472_013795 [Pythium oligandrum]|eukprot:TMW55033.1 hypothetical protein Poli38472_013795 [Pythium oligandrum]